MNITIIDRLSILFRNVSFLIGFFFLSTGGLFCFFVFGEANFSGYKYWLMPTGSTTGYIEYVEGTSATVNEEPVLEFGFSFADPETKESFRGASYDTYRDLQPGDKVTVEYLLSDPYTSRIEGMDSSIVPVWVVLLVMIFPTIGFFLCLPGIGKMRKQTKVLKNGVLTTARLVREEPTNTTINGRRVFRFYFAYQVNGTGYETTVETHHYEEITDEPEEELVYHRDRPAEALIVDDLPASIRQKVWKQLG